MASDVLKVVHDTLKKALQEGLADFEPTPEVRLGSLHVEPSTTPIVNVFFHNLSVNENGAKGLPRRVQLGGPDDGYAFMPPAIPMSLGFLITVFSDDVSLQLALIGKVAQIFQETPRRRPPTGSSYEEMISFTPDTRLTPNRVTELFRSHSAASRLSVGYITRVELRSEKVLREAPTTRSLNHKLRRQG